MLVFFAGVSYFEFCTALPRIRFLSKTLQNIADPKILVVLICIKIS